MVDPITSKAVTAQDRLTPVAPASRTPGPAAKSGETGAKRLELAAIAFDFGKASPVDEKRVDEIKRAVRNGTYPILPETIADRMLALKLNWSPKK